MTSEEVSFFTYLQANRFSASPMPIIQLPPWAIFILSQAMGGRRRSRCALFLAMILIALAALLLAANYRRRHRRPATRSQSLGGHESRCMCRAEAAITQRFVREALPRLQNRRAPSQIARSWARRDGLAIQCRSRNQLIAIWYGGAK